MDKSTPINMTLSDKFKCESNSSSKDETRTQEKPKKSNTPRCVVCIKKVGLLGFSCSCSDKNIFCGVHRLPENHSCNFDYKTKGKDSLSSKLIKVENEKLIKI